MSGFLRYCVRNSRLFAAILTGACPCFGQLLKIFLIRRLELGLIRTMIRDGSVLGIELTYSKQLASGVYQSENPTEARRGRVEPDGIRMEHRISHMLVIPEWLLMVR
jgi:hypothetical protein